MTYSGAVIDVDGTVVRGDDPIPGAPAGYRRLREAGVEPLFVSNHPTKAPPA
ncbi:HAD family hydrolase, partial [Halorubrum distributum]